MNRDFEQQSLSRCSIVSRASRRPDLPAGRPPRTGEVKEGRRPARQRRALSLTGLSTVAPYFRSRPLKWLDAQHGISVGENLPFECRLRIIPGPSVSHGHAVPVFGMLEVVLHRHLVAGRCGLLGQVPGSGCASPWRSRCRPSRAPYPDERHRPAVMA